MREKLKALWEKYVNRETVTYVIFGALTTLLDWGLFALLNKVFGMDELIANIFSTAAAIIFAFFTNKFIVFRSMEKDAETMGKESAKFLGSRLFTFGVQELLLFLTVKLLGFDGVLMKMLTSVIVIILNYFLSKLFIFVKANGKETSDEE